jgi:hypothetical protein
MANHFRKSGIRTFAKPVGQGEIQFFAELFPFFKNGSKFRIGGSQTVGKVKVRVRGGKQGKFSEVFSAYRTHGVKQEDFRGGPISFPPEILKMVYLEEPHWPASEPGLELSLSIVGEETTVRVG